MPTLITIREFQRDYSVSRSTVYRLRESGELDFIHIGRAVRIRRDDAERWYASLPTDAANEP